MSAPTPTPASSSSSSSSSPILRALARLRLDGALRLSAFFAGLRALCARYFGSLIRNALRRVREALRGRRRALLVGIQNVAELPSPAAGDADAEGLRPGRPRGGHKKHPKHSKHPGNPAAKTKAQAAVKEGGLKGPHHDVEAMRRVLIGACLGIWGVCVLLIRDCVRAGKYGYHPDDIVALVDDGNAAHLQPTQDNIVRPLRAVRGIYHSSQRLFSPACADEVACQGRTRR